MTNDNVLIIVAIAVIFIELLAVAVGVYIGRSGRTVRTVYVGCPNPRLHEQNPRPPQPPISRYPGQAGQQPLYGGGAQGVWP